MSASTLLKTKLRPSLIGRDIVTRARLLDRLDSHQPLTLIVAPAGYGKTTLVVDWLERAGNPYAWLTLDEYDDSLTAFITHVLVAIKGLYPNACPETSAALDSASPLLPSVIARVLINEMDALPQRFTLVLDEYHAIQDVAIHELMAELLLHQPNTLELVLVSRHDPSLPLPELRAHGRVTEIRIHELRFSPEETQRLLREMRGLRLDEQQITLLDSMTEGWPAGVRMASLFIQQQGSLAEVSSYLDQSGRFAMEYLSNELLDRQRPEMQEFLLKTAFLEEVCAPLSAAVIGGMTTAEQCQAHLDALTKNNLFVFSLHGEGAWHRYHNLLRTVLQQRAEMVMGAAEVAALHLRASKWLEANHYLDEAIGHAVKSGDVPTVAEIVRDHRQELINHAGWNQLETWRRLLPRFMVEQHPQLLILDAWSLGHRGLTADAGGALDAIDALMRAAAIPAAEERLLRSEMDALRSQAVYWSGDVERCLEAGRRALAAAPQEYAYTRALAWLFRILCLEMAGRAEADAALEDSLRELSRHGDNGDATLVFVGAGFLFWVRADMVRMEEYADRMLTRAQERNHLESATWARYLRGCARYQQNDLAGAAEDFAVVLNMAHIAHPLAHSQSVIGLAAAYQAQGQFDKAFAVASEGVQFARDAVNPVMLARTEAFLAHLAFQQGKMDEALRWVAQPSRVLPSSPMPGFHSALVGRAVILLGEGSAETRAEATELLQLLRDSVEQLHNTRFLIEVLALQALALASSGEEETGLDLLERAVLLTVPGESIRALADLDFMVGPLLDRLASRSTVRTQITRIRRAARVLPPGVVAEADAQPGGNGAVRAGAPVEQPAYVRDPDWLEKLTYREMDILVLLGERLSNKEIAHELNISVETVKSHLTHIFDKFDVENRRLAVTKARALGILPPK